MPLNLHSYGYYFILQISNYVESRFNKDRINCITNTFVTEVEEKVLHIMDAVTKDKKQIPYGMCVWAAGVGPRPLTKSIIEKLEDQTNRYHIWILSLILSLSKFYHCLKL